MAKALAAIRTVFLVFIIVYTLVVAPIALWDSSTAAITADAMRRLQRATWIAIAWIAFDTLLAWIVISFRRPRQAHAPDRPEQRRGPTAPPSVPPHR